MNEGTPSNSRGLADPRASEAPCAEPTVRQRAREDDLRARSKNFLYTRSDLRDLILGDGPNYESLTATYASGIRAVSSKLLALLSRQFERIGDAHIEEHIATAVSYSFFGLGHGMDDQAEAASLLFLSIWILDDCVMDSGDEVDRRELAAFNRNVKTLWHGHLSSPCYRYEVESSGIYDIVLFLLDRHLTLLKKLDIPRHFLHHHKTAFEYYLDSLAMELAFRAMPTHPYEAYKTIRVRSSGMKFSMTLMVLLKSLDGSIRPTFDDPGLNRAIEQSALYAALFNDIVSFPRERDEDVVNSVGILGRLYQNDHMRAIDRIHDDLEVIGNELLHTFAHRPAEDHIFKEILYSFCAWHKRNTRYMSGTELLESYYTSDGFARRTPPSR